MISCMQLVSVFRRVGAWLRTSRVLGSWRVVLGSWLAEIAEFVVSDYFYSTFPFLVF